MEEEFKIIKHNVKGYFIKAKYKPNSDLNPIGKWKQSNHLSYELKNYLNQNLTKDKELPKRIEVGGSDIEIMGFKKSNIYIFD